MKETIAIAESNRWWPSMPIASRVLMTPVNTTESSKRDFRPMRCL